MKNESEFLANLRAYLEYLQQDETCNEKVLQHVKCEIQRMENTQAQRETCLATASSHCFATAGNVESAASLL